MSCVSGSWFLFVCAVESDKLAEIQIGSKYSLFSLEFDVSVGLPPCYQFSVFIMQPCG